MSKEAENYLEHLNPVQRQAVETTEGPVLVLAGAGSGKTRVLTYRIAHICHTKKAFPSEILAMTFTNKAAKEMRERVQKLIGIHKGLWVGTFHSILAKILRWEAEAIHYTSDFVIYDTDDQVRLIRTVMNAESIPTKEFDPKSINRVISRLKNQLVDPESFARTAQSRFEEIVARVYPKYEIRMRAANAFDFDDLITVPIRLFSHHPQILEKYQSKFRYLLVDEYQDTNKAQYELLKLLCQSNHNLCVVGDDDQSIYRWRGADVRNILEFENEFPETKIFRLEQNYRSTQNILKAANSVVKHNVGRKEKALWSDREPGEKVDVLELADEREEAQKVVIKIRENVFEHKRGFRDFAILYRTNAQSRALEDALRRRGMSYVIVGSVRFYERKEIKDIIAYLKLIVNPKDDVSLKRIINFPLRGIGDTSIQRIEDWALGENLSLFEVLEKLENIPNIQERIKNSIQDFYKLIQKYMDLKNNLSMNELVHALVDEVELYKIYKYDTTPEGQSKAENVLEFLSAVNEYVQNPESSSLTGFLEQISLVNDVDNWDDSGNAVTLMTLHCAKGLEFPVVFITGLEEGLFPVGRCIDDPEALEEERRLFYVGLTRAKEKVYLFWAQRRQLFSDSTFRLPSRFLEELDETVVDRSFLYKKPLELSPKRRSFPKHEEVDVHPEYESFSQENTELRMGVWIEHDMFGKGQVMGVQGRGNKQKVMVRFEGGVEKKLLVQYATFTIVE